MLKKLCISMLLALAIAGPAAAQFEQSDTNVQYAVGETEPAADSKAWQDVKAGLGGEASFDVPQFKRYWVRAETGDNEQSWAVYGPLTGTQQVDVTPVDAAGEPTVQIAANSASSEKGLKCCKVKVKVRVRVVVKKPEVTVKAPSVTVKWRGPVPNVTVQGPEVTIENVPNPKITIGPLDSPIPESGSVPNVGMRCEVVGGDAKLYVQNGDKNPADVWIMWKTTDLGPIRIEGQSERSLGKTGYSDCKIAQDNIYITKAEGRS